MRCPICQTVNPAGAAVCHACAAPLTEVHSNALSPGTPLQDGVYLVGRVLGQGGFGITYLGQDTRLGRAVAIKEFLPAGSLRRHGSVQPSGALTVAGFQAAKAKFLEEARLLAQFRHPGIVDVYTCFEANGTAYMVMEFLEGHTLAALLMARGGRLSQSEAVPIIAQAGAALETVHQAGLLHRDIKPDNIMACPDGRVVLIDFGTVRDFAPGQTQRHSIVVTPGYAPLEQYAHQARRGPFTDVYALAATLYHLLTGAPPAAASDRVMGLALTPAHLANPQVSVAVSSAIERGLAIEVARRPQSVGEFLRLLQEGLSKPMPGVTSDKVVTPYPVARAATLAQKPSQSDSPGAWITLGFIFLMVILSILMVFFSASNQQRTYPAPPAPEPAPSHTFRAMPVNPEARRQQVLARYVAWKIACQRMDAQAAWAFYAGDANVRVYDVAGGRNTRFFIGDPPGGLMRWMQEQWGAVDTVKIKDLVPPRLVGWDDYVNVVVPQHSDSAASASQGLRRQTWRFMGGDWLIVDESLETEFSRVKSTAPTR